MPYIAACKSTGPTALLFVLAALLLFGCRSSEPPAEQKKAAKETASITPAPPTPPASVTIAPLIVAQVPAHPTPDAPGRQPEPSPGKEAGELYPNEKSKKSRVVIIIDDMGYHQQLGRQFLQLDLNLTYSFLPDAPYTMELAETAFQAGRDILAHLPMEPKNMVWNPEVEVLMVQDQPERIRQKMAKMLAAVPHATGANNHMGSRFTENAGTMQVVIATLKNRFLFFIDSYTTAASQGWATARQQGVPTARRQVFLDNVKEPQKICRQIEQLVTLAKKQGTALGIGHPNPAMFTALTQCGKQRLDEVEIVGAHQVVQ